MNFFCFPVCMMRAGSFCHDKRVPISIIYHNRPYVHNIRIHKFVRFQIHTANTVQLARRIAKAELSQAA